MVVKNNIKINPNKVDLDKIKWAQKAIGKLLYLALGTRWDIAYSVLKLARYTSNPSKDHIIAMKRIFRYLKETKTFKTIYKKDNNKYIKGFCDTDYIGDKSSAKSTSSYIFIYTNNLIS